jgi:hypothetical protein
MSEDNLYPAQLREHQRRASEWQECGRNAQRRTGLACGVRPIASNAASCPSFLSQQ